MDNPLFHNIFSITSMHLDVDYYVQSRIVSTYSNLVNPIKQTH